MSEIEAAPFSFPRNILSGSSVMEDKKKGYGCTNSAVFDQEFVYICTLN